MGWTGGYVLLALMLAPYMRKYGKFTVPEFIGERFYSKTARVVAVICLIIVSVTYVIGQMKGVGIAFSRFLETEYNTGLYIGMGIVFFYAVLGGMKGITYTQIAQYVVVRVVVHLKHFEDFKEVLRTRGEDPGCAPRREQKRGEGGYPGWRLVASDRERRRAGGKL